MSSNNTINSNDNDNNHSSGFPMGPPAEDAALPVSVLENPQAEGTTTLEREIEVYTAVAEAMMERQKEAAAEEEEELNNLEHPFHSSQKNEAPSSFLKRPLEEATNLVGDYSLEVEHWPRPNPETFDPAQHHLDGGEHHSKRQRFEQSTRHSLEYNDVAGGAFTSINNDDDDPCGHSHELMGTSDTATLFVAGRRNSNSPAGSCKKINNEQWDIMYERLRDFKHQQGHCLVPKRYAADQKLGTWVETQRVQYKRLPRIFDPVTGVETAVQPNNRLTAERLQKLEDIGFAWSAKQLRKDTTISQKTPSDNNHHTTPFGDGRGIAVCAPAAVAAAAMNGEERSCDSSDVIRDSGLEAAEYVQGKPQQQHQRRQRLNDAQWEDMYQRLVQYKTEHGHCLVPRKYDRDQKLSTWVETQRVLWNRDYRKINPKAAVEAAVATAAAASIALADYDASNVEAPTPGVYEFVPLTTAPNGLGMNTEVYSNSSGLAPGDCSNGNTSGTGVVASNAGMSASPVTIAAAADRGRRLTQERKRKLDEVGFVWSLRAKRIEDHWDEMFKQLLEYRDEHGDCLVPSRYESNLKLGKWVETQRYEYTKRQRSSAPHGSVATGALDGAIPGLNPQSSDDREEKASRQTNPRLTEERLQRLERVGFQWKVKHKMKKYYDKQWESMFDRLKAFKEVNGHCIVPKRYPADSKLGTWVHTQRIQYRKLMAGTKKDVLTEEEVNVLRSCGEEISYRLTDERRARLEGIGFVWNMREGEKGAEHGSIVRNSYDDQWDLMFDTLKAYTIEFGNCLVPKRYKDNPKLGTWVDTQRVQYKKLQKKLAEQGKPHDAGIAIEFEDTTTPRAPGVAAGLEGTDSVGRKPLVGRLTEDRIRRLKELGFVWALRDDWQKHYEELRKFKQENGHCNVPARYAANRRLGIWVSAQRQQYKTMNQMTSIAARRAAPLTQDRIEMLNQLGFTWTIRSRDSISESWNQRFEELQRFKKKYGHCMVPSRYAESPELGIWVGTQRTQYRLYMKAKETGETISGAVAMNESRIHLLEELGFVWALRGSREDHMNLRHVHMHGPAASDGTSSNTSHAIASAGTNKLQYSSS